MEPTRSERQKQFLKEANERHRQLSREMQRSIAELVDVVSMGEMDATRKLLGTGADVNIRDYWGNTLLLIAAETGQADMTHLLLEYGADKEITDSYGLTALELALQLAENLNSKDHQEVTELLRQAEDVTTSA